MNIEQKIVDDLAALNLPIYEQGQAPGGQLPDEFLTYYIVDTVDTVHYNNLPAFTEYQTQLNIYTTDPSRVETLRKQIMKTLISKGWTRQGVGTSGMFEDRTTYTAWFMVFYFSVKESEV